MRIRRRSAPVSISAAALSDLFPHGSPSHQPFDSPQRPSDQSTEFGNEDERWRVEEEKNLNDGIRRIVDICEGAQEGANKLVDLQLPSATSSSSRVGAKAKSKTNKKLGAIAVDKKGDGELAGCKRLGNSSYVIMEGGSRCSRMNGRGWRCCQPTLVGYSLCEHHLGKGRRLRSMAMAVASTAHHQKKTKIGSEVKAKARSMSSLLSQNI